MGEYSDKAILIQRLISRIQYSKWNHYSEEKLTLLQQTQKHQSKLLRRPIQSETVRKTDRMIRKSTTKRGRTQNGTRKQETNLIHNTISYSSIVMSSFWGNRIKFIKKEKAWCCSSCFGEYIPNLDSSSIKLHLWQENTLWFLHVISK